MIKSIQQHFDCVYLVSVHHRWPEDNEGQPDFPLLNFIQAMVVLV